MQEIGRVTTKIKLGGGLNLLCLAGAGYVIDKTMTKIVEFNNAVRHGEVMDALLENSKELNEVIKQRKSEEDAKEEEEESN